MVNNLGSAQITPRRVIETAMIQQRDPIRGDRNDAHRAYTNVAHRELPYVTRTGRTTNEETATNNEGHATLARNRNDVARQYLIRPIPIRPAGRYAGNYLATCAGLPGARPA